MAENRLVPCEAEVTYLPKKNTDGTTSVSVIFDCNKCPFQQVRTFQGTPSKAKAAAISFAVNLHDERKPACATINRREPGRPS